ncbi:MAG: helix-hairpin-helix domain-containing protein [Planctomycetota bacterium]
MLSKSNRKGLVLVTVLWVVVLLSLIIAVVAQTSRMDTRICVFDIDGLKCRWGARAGFETAVAVLKEDTREADSLMDLWSQNEIDFNDIELDGCMVTVKVVDEAGKLNINTATKEQLMALPDMTEDIVESIADWRDKDSNPGENGAEAGYYKNLEYEYKIRNGAFRTIRELLLVKGLRPELFYGEDTNFNGWLDYNERDGDKTLPIDDGDDELDKGWIEYLTCYSFDRNKDAYGKKRIDINKADEKELVKSLEIKKSQAKWIVDNRKKEYKSIADLINDKSPKKPSKKKSDEAEPMDLETFSNIADRIAVDNKKKIVGRINVNTADKEVLTALLGGGEDDEKIAEDIISYRESLAGGMQSIAEIMNVESVKIKTFKKIAEKITTRSDVFTVRSFAKAQRSNTAGVIQKLEAVIDRGPSECRVLYWYQGANN